MSIFEIIKNYSVDPFDGGTNLTQEKLDKFCESLSEQSYKQTMTFQEFVEKFYPQQYKVIFK